MSKRKPKIAIIGAGIIGLSCAWELAMRGARVTIIDRSQPGHGASFAAAGMLAAGYEAAIEANVHPRLLELCQKSAELWPEFVASLTSISGYDVQYRAGETLAVASDVQAEEDLVRSLELLKTNGIACERLSTEQLQTLEPNLSTSISAAILLPNEGQVDNRSIISSLLAACYKSGVTIASETPADGLDHSQFDIILWSVGADERMDVFGIQPVKGAAFSLEPGSHLPSRVIRFGGQYIVPKKDRVIVGATSEPGVRNCKPDEILLGELRKNATRICPGIEVGEVMSSWSGLRPATQDHAPLLGRISSHEFIASGHYRNGILLAPITARLMADIILDDKVSELASAFAPDRFMPVAP